MSGLRLAGVARTYGHFEARDHLKCRFPKSGVAVDDDALIGLIDVGTQESGETRNSKLSQGIEPGTGDCVKGHRLQVGAIRVEIKYAAHPCETLTGRRRDPRLLGDLMVVDHLIPHDAVERIARRRK